MGFAEVSVSSPAAQRRTFSYAIPEGLDVCIGQAVWVPFGKRLLQGVVIQLTDTPAVEETRDIADVIDPQPVLSPLQVTLARWLSERYLTPLFEAVALLLPPGFERRTVTFLSSLPLAPDRDLSFLNKEQKALLDKVRRDGKISLKVLEKQLGEHKAQSLSTQLVRRGLVTRSYELGPARVKPKQAKYLSLCIPVADAQREAERLHHKRALRQAGLLETLCQAAQPVPLAQASKICQPATIKALVSRGLVSIREVRIEREPVAYERIVPSVPLGLTRSQQQAFESIKASLQKAKPSAPAIFLLHGVTGSGKTEVYLQALAEAVRLGKKGIVLVPEISLTPQTIERFAGRFPRRVAVMHSRLSLGEQFDEWQRIRNAEFDVVIGSRSAIFAPQPDLGLIVIDEEHEWTYKQDTSPHYHARDVAIKLAELTGAVVVLGSATPDVASYFHAERGTYRLLQLPERVTPVEGAALPDVEVVDLRAELRAGNRSIFSRRLAQLINRALANNEQIILFLNRRGTASYVQCRSCGFVIRCKRCDVALTYHFNEERLVCHQCSYRAAVPQICPQCLSRRIKFLGIGTQKIEEAAHQVFPQARLLRWDSDVTRQKGAHQKILDTFRDHDADILIGTQMVAKGLDLPQVTLVGVINADVGLNLPDFRSGERTFQLLSQV
ncbi:MAG: primosomal protein N', partial [Chloroflexi bacterium]|nr:primosomal protein N' [Chloroflexota bacterium]